MKKYDYNRLIEGYREWLRALNYADGSIKVGPEYVREFFEWLVMNYTFTSIDEITEEMENGFFEYLEKRGSKRTGLGLSISYIRSYQVELRRFSRYLNQTNQGHLGLSMMLARVERKPVEVFTKGEIQSLYGSCADDFLGMRDRAMVSVYYGCGLRRNEGANLEIKDVQLSRSMLHVRKGKNYKERYVPMVGRVQKDLVEYLEYGRPRLATGGTGNHFFVSYRGGTVGGQMLGERLKRLKKLAQINREGTLHALRHSIATHLLQAGMSLENIARFLGHSSLESTQIYTHISAYAK